MRGLTPGQAKVGQHADENIARMVTDPPRRSYVADPNLPCLLMVKEHWTEAKCIAYSSSGSPTCRTCRHRPALRTCRDPLAVYVVWERENRSKPIVTMPPPPVAIKSKEKYVMASKHGICSHCKQERTLVAHGKCTSCNYGPNAQLSSEEAQAKYAGKTPKLKTLPSAGKEHAAEEIKLPTIGNGQTTITIAIRDEDKDLFNRILERARRNRREPGHEILTLAEAALDNGSGTDKVEIGKLKKIVERMQSYPVPVGSAKEVFAEAFNMVLLRLGEMEG